ncbi:sulfofructosephosphate aldolase [Pseudonocardia hierapolitana]|uniref:Sulfofructosephosphate aldolase n=1 Tax=Pseudonocardia hierapolitana TaxID=1128676 RepID=A0A561SK69_9PSEU|nr:aldolase [Pseudonocardia hierapolitana]TWF75202.1 sulfofructosephosphate aldolase [Pseudonocardia hierapolitana]
MTARPALKRLARPSGGLAMLAVDQREALRAMIAERTGAPVPDEDVTAFKVAATRALTPHASAVLVDPQFGWEAVLAADAVDPACALIAAADHFVPGETEFVRDAVIDESLDLDALARQGAVALKLLVVWRPDGDRDRRVAMVEEFVARCRRRDLVSIIEPVSRAPLAGGDFDADAGILAAARELGALGADVYKTEVPTHGKGGDLEVREGCRRIDDLVDGAWVVLSSGVAADRFPDAVRLACEAGASGFLAGRAVWASVVGSPRLEEDLERVAVPALQRLVRVVDETVGR